ncbi:MAG: MlaD family protein [Polyangiaceae bacterium]|jgi:phospholipid/cholesterol/gamma-HCH transport system substrate-binding protein
MAAERSIEVKVGVLILVSLGILATFVLVMGGLSFEKMFSVYVDFDNPGGLQAGAPVRIAGVKVGAVKELAFLGGKVDAKTGRRTLVRAKLSIEESVRPAIHDDADFYVTTQGVLGEQYLAIDPGTGERPAIAADTVVKGIDPPRLDLFLAKAYDLLDTTVNGIRNNKELISDIAVNTAGLLKGLNDALKDNRPRIDRIVQNVEALSTQSNDLVRDARKEYVDNPKIQRAIDNIDHLTSDVERDATPLLKDAREAMANLNRVSATFGDPEEQAKLKKTLADVAELATRANATVADAQQIVAHMKKGEGTIGALVMDEAVYDDVQEMVRDLKHNPWKFLWKQ